MALAIAGIGELARHLADALGAVRAVGGRPLQDDDLDLARSRPAPASDIR